MLLKVNVPKLVVSPPLSPSVIDVPLKAALPLTEMVAPLASVIAPPALIVAVPLVTLRPNRFKALVSSICTFPGAAVGDRGVDHRGVQVDAGGGGGGQRGGHHVDGRVAVLTAPVPALSMALVADSVPPVKLMFWLAIDSVPLTVRLPGTFTASVPSRC